MRTLTALNALHRARFKMDGDTSGFNLGPLTEAVKSDTRTLEEILLQDCERRPDKTSVKKPDASSKYFGVSWCVNIHGHHFRLLTSLQE